MEYFRYFETEPTWVRVTGQILHDCELVLKVGEHPKTNFTICLEAFLESLPKEVLEIAKKHIIKILLDGMYIGVKKIPITDQDGNLIGAFTVEP